MGLALRQAETWLKEFTAASEYKTRVEVVRRPVNSAASGQREPVKHSVCLLFVESGQSLTRGETSVCQNLCSVVNFFVLLYRYVVDIGLYNSESCQKIS